MAHRKEVRCTSVLPVFAVLLVSLLSAAPVAAAVSDASVVAVQLEGVTAGPLGALSDWAGTVGAGDAAVQPPAPATSRPPSCWSPSSGARYSATYRRSRSLT
ncbi:hypothetical protein E2562_016854 [Oryza meyeriana var. granulata]|uniref:Uncharacterized protein n=1 Tax=Oryza meyeriana var. granulata TaxID=110450 RepID=A0A6G1BXY3_9ORYZ|nr:hypothetical protein E2562_016854 [Oryza meyeriana var. granulata]